MNLGNYEILENRLVAPGVYRLRLAGDTAALTAPGQFVDLRLQGFYLRRPLSVCDWDGGGMTLLYKLAGAGTAALSRLSPGQTLELLCGLGNGFDLRRGGERPLLIGGGIGAAPLYGLARRLLENGARPMAALGFNTAADALLLSELAALGVDVFAATADGSLGARGFVTAALPAEAYSYYYACGPEPMLRAVFAAAKGSGELSFEARMGCGFGACMGCSCQTLAGPKRICRDGPVMKKEELLWQS